jgi:hypothetical protein
MSSSCNGGLHDRPRLRRRSSCFHHRPRLQVVAVGGGACDGVGGAFLTTSSMYLRRRIASSICIKLTLSSLESLLSKSAMLNNKRSAGAAMPSPSNFSQRPEMYVLRAAEGKHNLHHYGHGRLAEERLRHTARQSVTRWSHDICLRTVVYIYALYIYCLCANVYGHMIGNCAELGLTWCLISSSCNCSCRLAVASSSSRRRLVVASPSQSFHSRGYVRTYIVALNTYACTSILQDVFV